MKLARAFMSEGIAGDMREGLEMTTSKKGKGPNELHWEFVTAEVKKMAKPTVAVRAADGVMKSMGYEKNGGRWSAPRADGSRRTPTKLRRGTSVG